jgi:hypothetical protein
MALANINVIIAETRMDRSIKSMTIKKMGDNIYGI